MKITISSPVLQSLIMILHTICVRSESENLQKEKQAIEKENSELVEMLKSSEEKSNELIKELQVSS